MPSHAAESCGELAMTRAGLLAGGKGPTNPEVRGVDALLAKCSDPTPSADVCRRVDNELTELVGRGTYGPNHPAILALQAKKNLCKTP